MKQFKDYFESVPSLETERFILGSFAKEDMSKYSLYDLKEMIHFYILKFVVNTFINFL